MTARGFPLPLLESIAHLNWNGLELVVSPCGTPSWLSHWLWSSSWTTSPQEKAWAKVQAFSGDLTLIQFQLKRSSLL